MDITFPFTSGGQTKTLRAYQPNGGGGSFHIIVDGWYQGTLERQGGELVAYLNPASVLTGDDISLIIEKIEGGDK